MVADWKGTEHPEQVVVVSGHLDSWDLGTGAIDDGAGVAVSMQAIHLLKELGIHPKRTVRFIAWMTEEQGSQGEAAYIADHGAEVNNFVGAIESDLGADHPIGIFYAGKRVFCKAKLRPTAEFARKRPEALREGVNRARVARREPVVTPARREGPFRPPARGHAR